MYFIFIFTYYLLDKFIFVLLKITNYSNNTKYYFIFEENKGSGQFA
jgi:hypothetical protein